MNTITKPLNTLITEQVESGVASDEQEAEELILANLADKALKRKLQVAQQQFANGEGVLATKELIFELLAEGQREIESRER